MARTSLPGQARLVDLVDQVMVNCGRTEVQGAGGRERGDDCEGTHFADVVHAASAEQQRVLVACAAVAAAISAPSCWQNKSPLYGSDRIRNANFARGEL